MKIKKRETFCLQFRACSCIVLEPTQNNAARAKNAFKKHPGLAKFGIAPGLGPGDRGFKSRSPDQNRQFSVRKLAVLTYFFQLRCIPHILLTLASLLLTQHLYSMQEDFLQETQIFCL